MCQSLAQGGQRCACSTRTRYQSLAPGDASWEAAAIEHASTSAGRTEMLAEVRVAAEAGDHDKAALIGTALRRGEALREANREAGEIMDDMRANGRTGMEEWGSVRHVNEGSRTPWGQAQYVEHVASGIVSVGCAGHGGIKLSKERNAAIPPALRRSSGWYEEDGEAKIVGMYHPEAFPKVMDSIGESGARAYFEGGVKSDFPDEYTAATGNPVDVNASWVLRDRAKREDKAAFRAAHANEFVTLGNGDIPSSLSHTWIPAGYAVTEARKDATGETRHYLVPQEEVITDHMWGANVLIDPNRDIDVTSVIEASKAPEADQPVVQGPDLSIDYTHLNEKARTTAANELDRRFRWPDNSVSSFGERLAQQGVRSKKQHAGGYTVETADGSCYSLKKASFDALTTVPDATSDLDRARIKESRARAAMDRIPAYDRAKKEAAATRFYKAQADREVAERADKAANPLRYYEGIQAARQEAFTALVTERGLTFD